MTAEAFDPKSLEGFDLLYFDLHGEAGQPYWAGDQGLFALRAETIKSANLGGAVVFASNCHLADAGNPMMAALISSGASVVIAGAGVNNSGAMTVFGASLLGLWVRKLLEAGLDSKKALRIAKARVNLALAASELFGDEERERVNRDTLAFNMYPGNEGKA